MLEGVCFSDIQKQNSLFQLLLLVVRHTSGGCVGLHSHSPKASLESWEELQQSLETQAWRKQAPKMDGL